MFEHPKDRQKEPYPSVFLTHLLLTLIELTKALVIPLLVLIQRLSKNKKVITKCKTITVTETISNAL